MRPAGIAPTRQVAPTPAVAVAFVDVLREHQQQYLESIGAAGSMLGETSGQMSALAASTTQLTRQLFDAQRALLTRQASFDAQFAAAVRHGDVDLDDPDLLSLDRWDAEKANRQLSALLDGWWWALNAQGEQMMDVTSARMALRRQVAVIDASTPAPGFSGANPLPERVLGMLDQDRSPDLTGLLQSLLDVLDAPGEFRPAMPASAHVAELAPTVPATACRSTEASLASGPHSLQSMNVNAPGAAVAAVSIPATVAGAARGRAGDAVGRDLTIRLDGGADGDIDGERWLHRLERLGESDRDFWDDQPRVRANATAKTARRDTAKSVNLAKSAKPVKPPKSAKTVTSAESGSSGRWGAIPSLADDGDDRGITTRIVMPMVAATSALTAVMALVG